MFNNAIMKSQLLVFNVPPLVKTLDSAPVCLRCHSLGSRMLPAGVVGMLVELVGLVTMSEMTLT